MGYETLVNHKLLEIAVIIDAEHEEACREQYNQGHNDGFDSGFASADDWLAQNEDAMAEHGWVRLPVDADGVPIRVGDVMAYEDNTKPMAVTALVPPAVFLTEDGPRYADMCRHYHAPTVEDVLREMLEKAVGYSNAHTTAAINAIAEYAAKLQLKEDE